MTKTLQEIQQENRRFIIKVYNPDFDPERFYYPAYQITLSKVLLALIKKDYLDIKQSLNSDILSVNGFSWDLTKQTLVEQSEETQRQINKLLNNEQYQNNPKSPA